MTGISSVAVKVVVGRLVARVKAFRAIRLTLAVFSGRTGPFAF